jgi:hypothetical protein
MMTDLGSGLAALQRRAGLGSGDGALLATLLEGAWRANPGASGLTAAELARATPLALRCGAAALAWDRVRETSLAATPDGQRLRAAARRSAIVNATREAALASIVARLNAAGVKPLIFKGWAVARRYARPHSRPYGDFDLLVAPAEREAALRILLAHCVASASKPEEGQFGFADARGQIVAMVDFHHGLPAYYATPEGPLLARATEVRMASGEILREPCPEDHLRIVVLHFLKHGGWRPVWLCDIAALVEAADADFDWNSCWGPDPIARSWVRAGVAAARELLGCQVPAAFGALRSPPNWLRETLLREWRAPDAARFRSPAPEATARYLFDKLASYWLNPISSSMILGSGPTAYRPVHLQVAYWTRSLAKAVAKSTL